MSVAEAVAAEHAVIVNRVLVVDEDEALTDLLGLAGAARATA